MGWRARAAAVGAVLLGAVGALGTGWAQPGAGAAGARAAAAGDATSGNPIFEGWYADPEGAVFGKTFWVYPTTSALYGEQTFFDAFSSSDLVHWSKHEAVLTGGPDGAIKWMRRAAWAPSVVEKDGRYYLFFSANDIQKDGEVGGIGVAVADKPDGSFADYLGKPLIDRFHNGAQPIDQFVFRDEGADGKGQWYIVYGGWRHCNIARLAPDFKSIERFEDGTQFKEITPQQYVEGPYMLQRGGKYYLMWSEGGWTGPDYSVAYGVSDSVTGPFKRVGKILQQDPAIATGAGHHSVIKVPGGGVPGSAGGVGGVGGAGDSDRYVIVYHRRPLGDKDGNHRVVCMDWMRFNADGKIEPVRLTFEGVERIGASAK